MPSKRVRRLRRFAGATTGATNPPQEPGWDRQGELMNDLNDLDSSSREETPCRIEPPYRLLQLLSLASRVFRLKPWLIEVDTALAVFMQEAPIIEAPIMEASIVEAMWAVAWAGAFTAGPHADITPTRPATN
jgi:hypothetical protein